jgi:acyl-CoA synthetase (NDP forming)
MNWLTQALMAGTVLAGRFRKLKQGLREIARNYDIVLLAPPTLGMISLAMMQAAKLALSHSQPPRAFDPGSTLCNSGKQDLIQRI